MARRERLDPALLDLDPRVAEGYYSDQYFNRAREILLRDGHRPVLRMQVFQKHDDVCLCGVDEAIGILKVALGDDFRKLEVMALHDGDLITARETVMTIAGDYTLFAHLETVYLGALGRRTRVATNVFRVVRAATAKQDKPVLFFPGRFDEYHEQAGDGYAYDVARRALGQNRGGVATDAQGEWWGSKGLGTMPHSLIAAYGGDTALATLKSAEHLDPALRRVSLVDYRNDCVGTTLEVAAAMLERFLAGGGDERFRLHGVRLDTSAEMVDASLDGKADPDKRHGVTPRLVRNVHTALREKAGQYPGGSAERAFYEGIGIIVSGGFDAEKIRRFEDLDLPVMAYGVGSSLFAGRYDFTADIVEEFIDGAWRPQAKTGRPFRPNPRLEPVA